MAGTKRSWEGKPLSNETNSDNNNNTSPTTRTAITMTTPQGSSSNILSMFETFRDELDEHHDRRERLIKTGRDVTALSKKIIFSLQRVRKTQSPIPPNIAKETQSRFTQIHDLFTSIVPDLQPPNNWRYLRQVSGAIQEYIEALSFNHYLLTQTLITIDEVAKTLPEGILVTEDDYIMGLFDLTGEIMRFAVTSLSTSSSFSADVVSGGGEEQDKDTVGGDRNHHTLPKLGPAQAGIVLDLRDMRSFFESISIPRRHMMLRDFGKKSDVMQSSVEKVERAAYGILVRGSERPKGWAPDLSGPTMNVETEIY